MGPTSNRREGGEGMEKGRGKGGWRGGKFPHLFNPRLTALNPTFKNLAPSATVAGPDPRAVLVPRH